MIKIIKWVLQGFSSDHLSYVLKGKSDHNYLENDIDRRSDIVTPAVAYGSGTGGNSRAGLFRTPISGGVQSATSAHGLPRPALAVRNLMEQVNPFFVSIFPSRL